ncbi:MAG: VOC family protein [Pseudomonadota bacterium]
MDCISHLSLPVSNLERSRRFYESVLGAETGRVTDDWIDIWLYGMQLTLQRGTAIADTQARRDFHFGATLPWTGWEQERDRLIALDAEFISAPATNEARREAKMYLSDPDGYVIEIKAYRNLRERLRPPMMD